MGNQDPQLAQAAAALKRADALLIAAGAGMGVDSGLPDFRGPQGFWKAYPAIGRLGYSFVEMANPEWFHRDAPLAWAFYGHRLNLYRRTIPHAGFAQILDWARAKPHGFFVFTSNVDGHFQKAGFPEDRIVECHGSIHHFQCAVPCCQEIWDASNEQVLVDEQAFRALKPMPQCRHCGKLARPNVLMFNDNCWVSDRSQQQMDNLEHWLKELRAQKAKLVVMEFGAGTAVPSVRYTSERVIERVGGTLIRVNPRENEVPEGQIGIPLGAAEGIAKIKEGLQALA